MFDVNTENIHYITACVCVAINKYLVLSMATIIVIWKPHMHAHCWCQQNLVLSEKRLGNFILSLGKKTCIN